LHVDLPEEDFERKMDEWRAVLQQELPHSEVLTEWTLGITEKHGMPVLDPAKQTITLRQTFWKLADATRKDHGIQLWRDRVSFNLIGQVGEPRKYEELEDFASEWIPRWAAHFGVTQCAGVTLEYVNLLSPATLPAFTESDLTLRLGDVVSIFHNMPNPLHGLMMPPFAFQAVIKLPDQTPPSLFTTRCVSAEMPDQTSKQKGPPQPALHLNFAATTHLADRLIPVKDVQREARQMHDLIIVHFQAFFTDRAKASFEPDVVDSSTTTR
jgi:hypothetical protein